jgi:hypothetical protein
MDELKESDTSLLLLTLDLGLGTLDSNLCQKHLMILSH